MMSKKQQKEIERRLIELVNNRNNDNKCGECNSAYPTWASYNIGIFLCGRCASVHKRILGPPKNISHVLSLTLDQWSPSQVDKLSRIGNNKARKKWNPKRVPFPYDADDDISQVEQYIRDKYINGLFRDDEIDYEADGAGNSGGRSRLNSNYSNVETRSRLNSYDYRPRSNSARNDLPKLTHRKLTTFEYTQYRSQVNTICGFGYSNEDAILESLLLSNGNIETAIDILELDLKINPNQTETAPQLPKRRPVVSKPIEPKLSEEWWKNNQQSQITGQSQGSGIVSGQITGNPMMGQMMGQLTNGQPQIYQYTDPITGQISYIDSNGQQYLDPTNPAHQQQLMQQTNPQFLQQQHTKQNILSLYGNQNNSTIPLSQQQTAQQQQQQQQFQPQQAQPQFTGLIPPQMSLQSQQLLQQSQMMPQATNNGFGQQYSPQYYQGQPGQPGQTGQGYGNQFSQFR